MHVIRDDAADDLIGEILDDKYRLEALVGAGGMGRVYQAVHESLNRRVAIKLLHPVFIGDAQALSRFHREARVAASIGHHNICEVYDIGESNGFPFLVMPLLEGVSLSRLMKNETLSLSRLSDIAVQILAALEEAHRANIVHRDLKPGNIYITEIGDRKDFVKVLDFGISKIIGKNQRNEDTQTAAIVGSPHYMAPEQARGVKQIDHRVDIYAMGVVLYEALTGRRPFVGDSFNEIMFNIVSGAALPPRSINPSIPSKLAAVIQRAMARDPHQRFSSAKEMSDALTQAVSHGLRHRSTASSPIPSAIDRFDDNTCTEITSTPRISKKINVVRSSIMVALGSVLLLSFSWSPSNGQTPPSGTPKEVEPLKDDSSAQTVTQTNKIVPTIGHHIEPDRTEPSRHANEQPHDTDAETANGPVQRISSKAMKKNKRRDRPAAMKPISSSSAQDDIASQTVAGAEHTLIYAAYE